MRKKIGITGFVALASAMALSGTASFAAANPSIGRIGITALAETEGMTEPEEIKSAETEIETETESETESRAEKSVHWTEIAPSDDGGNDGTGKDDSGELRKSMSELSSQIESLTTETKILRGEIETIKAMREGEAEGTESVEGETESEQEEVHMEERKFLKGIRKSLKKRTKAAISYSESELGAMTNDELVEANAKCCEAEREFYDKYVNAVFDNKDVQYLCGQYIAGLKNQFDAYDVWKEEGNISLYNELWDAGYAKRSSAVCEIADQYEVDFGDISEMRKKVEALEKKNSGTPSIELGYEAVLECQNHLNTLGFKNTADGSWGARTSKMLKRFQLMYGYGPVDGILTEEILGNLREEAYKIAPPETEAQTETQTEAAG